MKKPKALQTLNADSVTELSQGETSYFQDCEDLDILQSNNYREISEAHVLALMESIQETGIQAEVALVASQNPSGEIVLTVEDGHHRLEAIRRLRKEAERSGRHWLYRALPCRVRVATADTVDGAFAIASVMRNQLRKEENLWDKLAAFERLREAGESTIGISKLVGLDERSVRRILSLKRVPEVVRTFAKKHADTIKAATLYKLAGAIEKNSTEEAGGIDQLLAEAQKESPQRLSLAMDIANTFLTQSAIESVAAECASMMTFLALDQVPKGKPEFGERQGAAEDTRTPPVKAVPKNPNKGPRTGGAKAKKARLPDGWLALDPARLDTMMSDAGIPEDLRHKLAHLIASQIS